MDINLLGESHPSVALVLDNLSKLYFYQARFDEAETSCQQALAIRRRLLGEDHPDFVQSLKWLERMNQSKES
jgi:hypothetical protein